LERTGEKITQCFVSERIFAKKMDERKLASVAKKYTLTKKIIRSVSVFLMLQDAISRSELQCTGCNLPCFRYP